MKSQEEVKQEEEAGLGQIHVGEVETELIVSMCQCYVFYHKSLVPFRAMCHASCTVCLVLFFMHHMPCGM